MQRPTGKMTSTVRIIIEDRLFESLPVIPEVPRALAHRTFPFPDTSRRHIDDDNMPLGTRNLIGIGFM